MWMVWRSAQFCHGLRIDTLLTDFHKTKSVPWVSNSFSVFLQKLLERAFRIPRDQWSLSHQAWSPAMFRVDTGHPQTLIGVGGKRIRRSSGIKLTNCKLTMKQKKLPTICFRHSLQSLSRSRLITKNKQEITPTQLAAWTLIQSNCPSCPIHDSCGT